MAESYNEPGMTKGNSKSYTANPRAPRGGEIEEPTGPITSDSLANESINAGGVFSENTNPEVLGVKGANSTLTNTNTSGARTLNPAEDRESRDGSRFTSTDYPSDATSQDAAPRGVYNTQRSRADEGAAPTYAEDFRSEGEMRPRGKDLVEGQGIPPNRSTYTGDVGGPKDPGRLAEAQFELRDAASANVAGYPRDTSKVDSDNAFDALDSSERA